MNVSTVGTSVSLLWMGVSQGKELLHTESMSCINLSEQWHTNLSPAQVSEPAWLRTAIHFAAEITNVLKLCF